VRARTKRSPGCGGGVGAGRWRGEKREPRESERASLGFAETEKMEKEATAFDRDVTYGDGGLAILYVTNE
jgi:hypothetical protein